MNRKTAALTWRARRCAHHGCRAPLTGPDRHRTSVLEWDARSRRHYAQPGEYCDLICLYLELVDILGPVERVQRLRLKLAGHRSAAYRSRD